MDKNKIYIVVFALFFIFIILLGVMNILSSKVAKTQQTSSEVQNQYISPTENILFPTRSLTPTLTLTNATEASQSAAILIFAYPLKYGNLIIDYLPNKNQLIIYFPATIEEARTVFTEFLTQYKVNINDLNGMKIDYIGLMRDPNEATPGSSLK